MDSEPGRAVAIEAFGSMRGQRIWRSELGVGSFITLDVGGRRFNSVGKEQGKFHLWVYGAPWSLLRRDGIEMASDDLTTQIRIAISELTGHAIQKISMNPIDLGLEIETDGDIRISTRSLNDPEIEDWMLFMPDGMVLTAQQGALTHERADTPSS